MWRDKEFFRNNGVRYLKKHSYSPETLRLIGECEHVLAWNIGCFSVNDMRARKRVCPRWTKTRWRSLNISQSLDIELAVALHKILFADRYHSNLNVSPPNEPLSSLNNAIILINMQMSVGQFRATASNLRRAAEKTMTRRS